jgi:hypothetical protein
MMNPASNPPINHSSWTADPSAIRRETMELGIVLCPHPSAMLAATEIADLRSVRIPLTNSR